MTDRLLSGDRNQCAGCGEMFNSSAAFDKHRTGAFGVDRRCRTPDEMRKVGMSNDGGWWITEKNQRFAPDMDGLTGTTIASWAAR